MVLWSIARHTSAGLSGSMLARGEVTERQRIGRVVHRHSLNEPVVVGLFCHDGDLHVMPHSSLAMWRHVVHTGVEGYDHASQGYEDPK